MWYYDWSDAGIAGLMDDETEESEPVTEKSGGVPKPSDSKPGIHTHRCVRCKEPFGWVEANQPDGTFKCYQCRQDPYR